MLCCRSPLVPRLTHFPWLCLLSFVIFRSSRSPRPLAVCLLIWIARRDHLNVDSLLFSSTYLDFFSFAFPSVFPICTSSNHATAVPSHLLARLFLPRLPTSIRVTYPIQCTAIRAGERRTKAPFPQGTLAPSLRASTCGCTKRSPLHLQFRASNLIASQERAAAGRNHEQQGIIPELSDRSC